MDTTQKTKRSAKVAGGILGIMILGSLALAPVASVAANSPMPVTSVAKWDVAPAGDSGGSNGPGGGGARTCQLPSGTEYICLT